MADEGKAPSQQHGPFKFTFSLILNSTFNLSFTLCMVTYQEIHDELQQCKEYGSQDKQGNEHSDSNGPWWNNNSTIYTVDTAWNES